MPKKSTDQHSGSSSLLSALKATFTRSSDRGSNQSFYLQGEPADEQTVFSKSTQTQTVVKPLDSKDRLPRPRRGTAKDDADSLEDQFKKKEEATESAASAKSASSAGK